MFSAQIALSCLMGTCLAWMTGIYREGPAKQTGFDEPQRAHSEVGLERIGQMVSTEVRKHVSVVPLSRLPVVMVNKPCPTREESISMALWEDGRVTLNVTGGGREIEPVELSSSVGQLFGRVFDVEYGRVSGVALAVSYDASGRTLRCCTYDGERVIRRASLPVPGELRVGYLGLRARGETDQIVLMLSGVGRSGKIELLTNTWDGREWKGWETVSEDLEKDQSGAKKPAQPEDTKKSAKPAATNE